MVEFLVVHSAVIRPEETWVELAGTTTGSVQKQILVREVEHHGSNYCEQMT